MKSLADRRIRNLDPNSNQAKGDRSQELACRLYEYIDLNKKHDNYESLLDCYNPKTGLYHQVQGRHYNSKRGFWPFSNFEAELFKNYENMVCFCFSKDKKTVERIYKFPKEEIERVKGIAIVKNSSRWTGWYEQYRVTSKGELNMANEIYNNS